MRIRVLPDVKDCKIFVRVLLRDLLLGFAEDEDEEDLVNVEINDDNWGMRRLRRRESRWADSVDFVKISTRDLDGAVDILVSLLLTTSGVALEDFALLSVDELESEQTLLVSSSSLSEEPELEVSEGSFSSFSLLASSSSSPMI